MKLIVGAEILNGNSLLPEVVKSVEHELIACILQTNRTFQNGAEVALQAAFPDIGE